MLSSDKWTPALSQSLPIPGHDPSVHTCNLFLTEVPSKFFCRLGSAHLSSIVSVGCNLPLCFSTSQQPQMPLSHGSFPIQELGVLVSQNHLSECQVNDFHVRGLKCCLPDVRVLFYLAIPPEVGQIFVLHCHKRARSVTTVPSVDRTQDCSLSLQRFTCDGSLSLSPKLSFFVSSKMIVQLCFSLSNKIMLVQFIPKCHCYSVFFYLSPRGHFCSVSLLPAPRSNFLLSLLPRGYFYFLFSPSPLSLKVHF